MSLFLFSSFFFLYLLIFSLICVFCFVWFPKLFIILVELVDILFLMLFFYLFVISTKMSIFFILYLCFYFFLLLLKVMAVLVAFSKSSQGNIFVVDFQETRTQNKQTTWISFLFRVSPSQKKKKKLCKCWANDYFLSSFYFLPPLLSPSSSTLPSMLCHYHIPTTCLRA